MLIICNWQQTKKLFNFKKLTRDLSHDNWLYFHDKGMSTYNVHIEKSEVKTNFLGCVRKF